MTVKLPLAEVRGFHAQSLGHGDPRGASALSGPLDIGKTPRARCQNLEGTSALCRIQSVTQVRAKYLTTALALAALHAAHRVPSEADASSARRRNKDGLDEAVFAREATTSRKFGRKRVVDRCRLPNSSISRVGAVRRQIIMISNKSIKKLRHAQSVQ
jgi:hypothetical protein